MNADTRSRFIDGLDDITISMQHVYAAVWKPPPELVLPAAATTVTLHPASSEDGPGLRAPAVSANEDTFYLIGLGAERYLICSKCPLYENI